MSLPTEIPVLVVGAGPVGLASAITLTNLGVQVAVVDSSPTNQNGCRASVVHARTLEVLSTIGLAQPVIKAGIVTEGIVLHGKATKLIQIDLSTLLHDYTEFPMSVLIPQHTVEKIFEERLSSQGIHVYRGKNVVGIRAADRDAKVEVFFEDGSVIRTRYVIGADGSRSTLRRLGGIDFKDPSTGVAYDDASRSSSSSRIVLSDIHLEEPLPASLSRDRVSAHLDNFLLLIPLPSNTSPASEKTSFWRIGFGISTGTPDAPKVPSLEYLQQLMDSKNPWGTKVTISSFASYSRYRVRSAVATTFFQKMGDGYILLAGDAAHVHSPAGGQGMNLGICDGVALGHAIHSHIEAKYLDQRDVLFHDYDNSRRSTAIKVISLAKGLDNLTERVFGWRRLVRNMLIWTIGHLPYVKKLAAWRISGLGNRPEAVGP